MADSVRISQLELIDRLTIDDIIVVNNENVNTNSIKFSNVMNSIQEYPALNFQGSVVFSGNVSLPPTTVLNKSLNDLTDVILVNPAAEQVLYYNGVTWTNKKVTDLEFNMNIDGLLDVVVLDPEVNQILVYNGASWTNLDNPSYTKAEVDALVADKPDYQDIKVTQAPAVMGGSLTYNNQNGEFTFAPDSNDQLATYAQVNALTGGDVEDGHLGVFDGTTVSTNVNVKTAIQELETALEAQGDVDLTDVYTLFGVADGDTNLGSFTGNPSYPNSTSQISDNASVRVALQDLNNAIITNNQLTVLHISDAYALFGVPSGERDLGTFNGSTISDNTTVKSALQELETAVENAGGGFSGSYNDLTDTPTLGTAAATDASAYATAAQGTTADTALQPADIGATVQGYDANTVVDADYATVKSDAAATATTAGQNDNAIDNLIAALVAIGNDAGVTDTDGLKTALAALARDND